MAMIHTISATPLERVTIEPSPGDDAHVWLRRNIAESAVDTEGVSAPVWEADEGLSVAGRGTCCRRCRSRFRCTMGSRGTGRGH